MSIQTTGPLKDNWHLELSSATQANLPFDRIDPQKLFCTFKHTAYAVTAQQGTFTKAADADLRIVPQAGRVMLDFSSGRQ